MSDHRFLKFWFDIDKTKRGPGYWKLNISYLENERYKIGISNIIQNIDLSLDPITLWETIKQKAKDFSITFAKNEQKSIKQRIKIIEHEIDEIEKGNLNNFDYKRIKTLEAELDEIHDKKTKGAQIRSKLRWIEEGEKNSKYFLNLEKHNQSSNIIKELKTKDGKKIDKTNAILGEMQSFYSDIYTSKNISDEKIENYLSELVNLPKINNENILALEMFPT